MPSPHGFVSKLVARKPRGVQFLMFILNTYIAKKILQGFCKATLLYESIPCVKAPAVSAGAAGADFLTPYAGDASKNGKGGGDCVAAKDWSAKS